MTEELTIDLNIHHNARLCLIIMELNPKFSLSEKIRVLGCSKYSSQGAWTVSFDELLEEALQRRGKQVCRFCREKLLALRSDIFLFPQRGLFCLYWRAFIINPTPFRDLLLLMAF